MDLPPSVQNQAFGYAIVVSCFSSMKNIQSITNSSSKSTLEIPILSFFTGAGFLDIGFMRAGFNIIWHNELEPNFIECFESGIASLQESRSTSQVENKLSIRSVGWKRIAQEAFHNTARPNLFGIIGGPPCPDFSVGGKNLGSEGEQGRLSQSYVNRILKLEPTFFVFENVSGLVRTAKHQKFLIGLMEQLSSRYDLDLRLLNSLEFGVPQDRQRLFLIGFRRPWIKQNLGTKVLPKSSNWFSSVSLKDVGILEAREGWPNWFAWMSNQLFPGAKKNYEWPQQSRYGSTPPEPVSIPKQLMVGPSICSPEIYHLPNSHDFFQPYSSRFMCIEEGDVSRKSFKRLHRWRYSPAAAYGNNEVHLHPVEPRRLSVREALRLQTVPDVYNLPAGVPLTHKFKAIGNGVPVRLAQCVAESLAAMLK